MSKRILLVILFFVSAILLAKQKTAPIVNLSDSYHLLIPTKKQTATCNYSPVKQTQGSFKLTIRKKIKESSVHFFITSVFNKEVILKYISTNNKSNNTTFVFTNFSKVNTLRGPPDSNLSSTFLL